MNCPCVIHDNKRYTLYEFFEVKENCTDDELKTAYRALCRKFHPDINEKKAEAEANFKSVQAVWAILGNPLKRKEYDRKLAIKRGEIQEPGISIQFQFFTWGFDGSGTTMNTTTGW